MDLIETSRLVEFLHPGTVDPGLAGKSDAFEQQIQTAPDSEVAVVGKKVLQVEMAIVKAARTLCEMGLRGDPVPKRMQFEHGQVKAAAVEGDDASAEILSPAPELAHQVALRCASQILDRFQNVVLVDVADGDGNRYVQGGRKETAAQFLAQTLVGLFLVDLQARIKRIVQQTFVDAGLNIKNCKSHRSSTLDARPPHTTG